MGMPAGQYLHVSDLEGADMKRRSTNGVITTIIVSMALLTAALLLIAGCGGSSEEDLKGIYKLKQGESFTATLTLKDEGEGSFSITDGAGVPITYRVKDKKVILYGLDGKTPLTNGEFKIVERGLEDKDGALYEKQR